MAFETPNIKQKFHDSYESIRNNLNTISDKLDNINFLNIRDFGAKGDGVNDDTEAIHDCFSNVTEGDTVYIPPGVYMHTGLTFKPSDVYWADWGTYRPNRYTIMGAGRGSQLKLINGSNANSLTIINAPRLNLLNFSLEGNKGNQTQGTGIHVTESEYIGMSFVEVMNCKDDGVYISAINKAGYDHPHLNDEVQLSNCWIQQNGGNGIVTNGVSDILFTSLHVQYNELSGVKFTCDVDNLIYAGGNISVVNCNIGTNTLYGIECINDSDRTFYQNNQVRLNKHTGIKIQGGQQHTLIGNNVHMNCYDNAYNPGILLNYVDSAKLIGNEITNAGKDGYSELVGTDRCHWTAFDAYSVGNLKLIGNNFLPTNSGDVVYIDENTTYKAFMNDGLADKTT